MKCFKCGPGVEETDPVKLEAVEYVNKKYNISLEGVQIDGYDGLNATQCLTAAESSGAPAAHIVCMDPDSFTSAISAGLMHDFSDSYQNWGMNKWAIDAGTWNGKVYGWCGDKWGAEGLIYNRDELKEYGMEKMPTDLFLEGNWDYDSCRAYLAELQAKLPDGKYAIGTYPYHWGRIAANANGVVLGENDGTVNLANDAVIEATEFYQSLMDDGLAYPMGTTTDADGNVVGDIVYGADDDRIVITYGSPGQQAKPSFCPFPWSSNYVTCDGDYTAISNNYCTSTTWWWIISIMESAEADCGIPADVLMQIYIDFEMESNGGEENKENYSPMTQQDDGTYQNPDAGTVRSFVNEDDMKAFDWATSRRRHDFSWFMAETAVDYWTAFRDCLRDRLDARSTMESYQQAGEQALKDAGLVD